ncbi:hypothetical protein HPB50_011677 [Hyalomma asiaticum]|uniref:Uncharacterized protein n=1 Tax=Hyalomma asiaticum TaxID=266040 RepID=A0ACB7SVB9_HYAAI|nr:hypothetical protein HPB50_011677 [Hyalomma asiaticum]
MTENVPLRAPAPRVRFTPGDDMALIQVVAEVRPMCDPGKWQEVARLVQELTGKVSTPQQVRERFDLLLVQFRRKDTKNRTRSGVEEDFGEWERLLQELTNLAAEWGYKLRAVERQRRRQKEPNDTNVAARPAASQAAAEIQAAASEAYAAAALEDAQEMSAEHYLMQMYHPNVSSGYEESTKPRSEHGEDAIDNTNWETWTENPGADSRGSDHGTECPSNPIREGRVPGTVEVSEREPLQIRNSAHHTAYDGRTSKLL